MTLTLIKGEFPRDVIANENIHFEPYTIDQIEESASLEQRAPISPVHKGDHAMFFIPLALCLGWMLWTVLSRQLTCALLGLMVLIGSP